MTNARAAYGQYGEHDFRERDRREPDYTESGYSQGSYSRANDSSRSNPEHDYRGRGYIRRRAGHHGREPLNISPRDHRARDDQSIDYRSRDYQSRDLRFSNHRQTAVERRSASRRGERRQRRSEKIQRNYLYGRVPMALFMVALVSVAAVALMYAASVGVSLTADVFSFLGRALTNR